MLDLLQEQVAGIVHPVIGKDAGQAAQVQQAGRASGRRTRTRSLEQRHIRAAIQVQQVAQRGG